MAGIRSAKNMPGIRLFKDDSQSFYKYLKSFYKYTRHQIFKTISNDFKNMSNIRSAVVCVTLLDRLKGDQVHHMVVSFGIMVPWWYHQVNHMLISFGWPGFWLMLTYQCHTSGKETMCDYDREMVISLALPWYDTGWFLNWVSPKNLKYGKSKLSESTLTEIVLDTPNLA